MDGTRALLVALLLTGGASAQEPPSLRRLARTESSATDVRLWPVGAPRLQHWLGSPDGRTLAGVGQPEALEHPFELRLEVWRDGVRVAAPEERFATESELTVGADGTVALVGHAPGHRGEPFALVLAADGTLLHRHALPRGTLARDPVLFGERLLVRTHGLLTEGVDGAIQLVDGAGARVLAETPGVLVLAGFPADEGALVLSRDAVVYLDARDGHERWRRALALRPASEHAFALWRAPERDSLAIVTTGLPRAGELGAALWLFAPRDGALLVRQELEPLDSPAEVELTASADRLVLERGDAREEFAWER